MWTTGRSLAKAVYDAANLSRDISTLSWQATAATFLSREQEIVMQSIGLPEALTH